MIVFPQGGGPSPDEAAMMNRLLPYEECMEAWEREKKLKGAQVRTRSYPKSAFPGAFFEKSSILSLTCGAAGNRSFEAGKPGPGTETQETRNREASRDRSY